MNGTIRPYTDALGRSQTAVDGPNGTYLITRSGLTRDLYEVWKSDSLTTVKRTRNGAEALEAACKAAGLEI